MDEKSDGGMNDLRDDGNYDGINYKNVVGRDYGNDDEWMTKTFTVFMTEMMT